MPDEDPLAREKEQILTYARSLLTPGGRIEGLRWGVAMADGVPLIAEMGWGRVSLMVLPEPTIRSYGCDASAREGIQRCLRAALKRCDYPP